MKIKQEEIDKAYKEYNKKKKPIWEEYVKKIKPVENEYYKKIKKIRKKYKNKYKVCDKCKQEIIKDEKN